MYSKNDTIRVAEIVSKLPTISWPPAEHGKKYKFTDELYEILKKIIETVDDGKMYKLLQEDTHTQEKIIICLNNINLAPRPQNQICNSVLPEPVDSPRRLAHINSTTPSLVFFLSLKNNGMFCSVATTSVILSLKGQSNEMFHP